MEVESLRFRAPSDILLSHRLKIDSFQDLLDHLRSETLLLEGQSLGFFFEKLRYESETMYDILQSFDGEWPSYGFSDSKWEKLVRDYGFSEESPATMIKLASANDLMDFTYTWQRLQGANKRWNPAQIEQPELSDKVSEFCRRIGPGFLSHFNVSDHGQLLIYPFTGWELAECARQAYERV